MPRFLLAVVALLGLGQVSGCASQTSTYSPTEADSSTTTPVPTIVPLGMAKAVRVLCSKKGLDFTADEPGFDSFFAEGTYLASAGTTNVIGFVSNQSLYERVIKRCPKRWKGLRAWYEERYSIVPTYVVGVPKPEVVPDDEPEVVPDDEPDVSIGVGPQYDVNPSYSDYTYEDCLAMAHAGADGYVETDDDFYNAVQQCYRTAEYYGN